jgi:hypothetical protein
MSEAYKSRKRRSPPPAIPPGQRCIVFESRVLRGLTGPQRTKAVRQLAHLLMLAAGAAIEENGVER